MNNIEVKSVKHHVLINFREILDRGNDYVNAPNLYLFSNKTKKISNLAKFSRLTGVAHLCEFISDCLKVIEETQKREIKVALFKRISEVLNLVGVDLVNFKNLPLINYKKAWQMMSAISSEYSIEAKKPFAFIDVGWNPSVKSSQEDFYALAVSEVSDEEFYSSGPSLTRYPEFAAACFIAEEALRQNIDFEKSSIRKLISEKRDRSVIELAELCSGIYSKLDDSSFDSVFSATFIGRKDDLLIENPPNPEDVVKFINVVSIFKDHWVSASSSRVTGNLLKFTKEFSNKHEKMKSAEFSRLAHALHHAVSHVDEMKSRDGVSESEWVELSNYLWIDGAICIHLMGEILSNIRTNTVIQGVEGAIAPIESILLSYGSERVNRSVELPDSLMSKTRESAYKTLIDNLLVRFGAIQQEIDSKAAEFAVNNSGSLQGFLKLINPHFNSISGAARFLQMTHLLDSCEHLKNMLSDESMWKDSERVEKVIQGISKIVMHLEAIDVPMPEDLPFSLFTPESSESTDAEESLEEDVAKEDEATAAEIASASSEALEEVASISSGEIVAPEVAHDEAQETLQPEQIKGFSEEEIESSDSTADDAHPADPGEHYFDDKNSMNSSSIQQELTDEEHVMVMPENDQEEIDFFDEIVEISVKNDVFSKDENRFEVEPENIKDNIEADFVHHLIDEIDSVQPQIEDIISSWRKTDSEDKSALLSLLNSLNRHIHTIKGACRTVGFLVEGHKLHLVEDEIDSYKGSIPPNSFIDTYEVVIDTVIGIVRQKAQNILNSKQVVSELSGAVKEEAQNEGEISAPGAAHFLATEKTQDEENISAQQSIRVPTKIIQEIGHSSNEVAVLNTKTVSDLASAWKSMDELSSNLDRLSSLLKELEIHADIRIQATRQHGSDDFDPLQLDRYTRLNEITRSLSENIQDINSSKSDLSFVIGKIEETEHRKIALSDTIQSETNRLMVVPFNSQKSRIEKVIQKACRETGKLAQVIHMGDMDVPGVLLEKLIPVIEHVLRNSVTHGIEDREKRRIAGKNERGSVYIIVKNEGAHCSIVVRDDGAGIDKISVLNKAIERGVISSDQNMTEKEIFDILFIPGFSTAEKVTSLAGRGVGLDAVKQSVSELGGSISVQSEKGEYCEFKIDIPIDISTSTVIPMTVGGYGFMVPSNLAVKIVTTTQAKLASTLDGDEIILDGLHCKYRQARSLFGDVCGKSSSKAYAHIAICGVDENNLIALHVDRIEAYRKVVVRPISKHISSIPGLVAASVLGDGTPCLIINPMRMAVHVQSLTSESETNDTKVVMIVDDSSTVRMVASRFLRKQGFEVIEAIDGIEALDHIKNGINPDIFLLDIEMPRMDGFELTEALRKIEKTQFTPIIMITSRIAQKHREHALNLGVDEYLGKPYEEKELLSLMKKHLYYSTASSQ